MAYVTQNQAASHHHATLRPNSERFGIPRRQHAIPPAVERGLHLFDTAMDDGLGLLLI